MNEAIPRSNADAIDVVSAKITLIATIIMGIPVETAEAIERWARPEMAEDLQVLDRVQALLEDCARELEILQAKLRH